MLLHRTWYYKYFDWRIPWFWPSWHFSDSAHFLRHQSFSPNSIHFSRQNSLFPYMLLTYTTKHYQIPLNCYFVPTSKSGALSLSNVLLPSLPHVPCLLVSYCSVPSLALLTHSSHFFYTGFQQIWLFYLTTTSFARQIWPYFSDSDNFFLRNDHFSWQPECSEKQKHTKDCQSTDFNRLCVFKLTDFQWWKWFTMLKSIFRHTGNLLNATLCTEECR